MMPMLLQPLVVFAALRGPSPTARPVVGQHVAVLQKQHYRTGERTHGVVADVLTRAPQHCARASEPTPDRPSPAERAVRRRASYRSARLQGPPRKRHRRPMRRADGVAFSDGQGRRSVLEGKGEGCRDEAREAGPRCVCVIHRTSRRPVAAAAGARPAGRRAASRGERAPPRRDLGDAPARRPRVSVRDSLSDVVCFAVYCLGTWIYARVSLQCGACEPPPATSRSRSHGRASSRVVGGGAVRAAQPERERDTGAAVGLRLKTFKQGTGCVSGPDMASLVSPPPRPPRARRTAG